MIMSILQGASTWVKKVIYVSGRLVNIVAKWWYWEALTQEQKKATRGKPLVAFLVQ